MPQSHSQPVVSAASPVSRCAADGASRAPLGAVPGGQHGLCTHPADVHGETPGVGRGKSSMERRAEMFGATLSNSFVVFEEFVPKKADIFEL